MKKTLLIILSAVGLCSNVAMAQYTLDKDTARGTIYNNGMLEVKDKITNTSNASMIIKWTVTGHTLPTGWTVNGFGVCDNQLCYSYTKDGQTNGNQINEALPLAPNEAFDLKLQIEVAALPTGGPYYITTNLTDGTTSKPQVFEITNRFNTSITNVNKVKEDVIMYPNPARGELNVIYNGNASIKNISVYNLIGKAVNVYKVTSNNNASLDISSIPSGIYFIRLVDAQGRVVATRKFTHQ